ncbi:MAG: DUF4846 domain-containing protein [FCB group bacterium]|nr:DUF4846 domain-containing protein [FCB group bacterium]
MTHAWREIIVKLLSICFLILFTLLLPHQTLSNEYKWLAGAESTRSIADNIEPPEGYERIKTAPDSFADWLRHLPLKPQGSPVLLFDRREKRNQGAHFAVLDIDIGTRDLQQCADAVIRLRAEYLYSTGKLDEIVFRFTSGHESSFNQWARGDRPVVDANNVIWQRNARSDSSYDNFRKYLSSLFVYAGSYSLNRELIKREDINDIEIGDVFIRGGFPGHAVIIVDMARNDITEDKIFIIAQSYMPAQDIHILNNPQDSVLSPWYCLPAGDTIHTPEWIFLQGELRSFR